MTIKHALTFITLAIMPIVDGRASGISQSSCPTIAPRTSGLGRLRPPAKGPASASVTIIVFSDFECFQCGRSAAVLSEITRNMPNDVRLIFKSAPASTNVNAFRAHEAAIAAGAQGKFWEMHDLLFANQQKVKPEDLMRYAEKLGLDTKAFQQALDDHRFRSIVEQDLEDAKGFGVTTTPTFFVNGRRVVGPQGEAALRAVVESVLTVASRQRPREIVAASGPAQTIDLKQAPTKGSAGAPISLVEFSDFECPFCAKSASVISAVLKEYPTQVRLAFKNYPLPFHRESPLAHEAALAAAEQGHFWEMHDLLFASQDKLTRQDLIEKAQHLHLDMSKFISALDTRHFKNEVDADRQEGDRLGVDGTPFFFINGHAVPGVADVAEFKRLIDAALKESTTK